MDTETYDNIRAIDLESVLHSIKTNGGSYIQEQKPNGLYKVIANYPPINDRDIAMQVLAAND